MSVLAWVLIGVLAWVLLSVVVALLVGRVVRQRDRQVPRYPCDGVADEDGLPGPRGSDENRMDGRAGARPPGGGVPPR